MSTVVHTGLGGCWGGGETEVFSNERKTIDVGEVVGLAVVRAVVGAITSSP